MRLAWNLLLENRAKIFDLLIGNRSPQAFSTHEAEHARRPQHFHSRVSRGRDSHEGIARKSWNLYFAPSVAPPVHLLEQRKESENILFLQEVRDAFLKARPGINCIPSGLLLDEIQREVFQRSFKVHLRTGHSFALSVPFLGSKTIHRR